MALSTTTLKLSEVTAEIAGVQGSLQDCVDDAVGTFDGTYYTAPADRLTDFRGYTDSAGTAFQMSSFGQSTEAEACAETAETTRYHDGASTYPSDTETIYTNSILTTTFNGGSNWFKIFGNSRTIQVSSAGAVVNDNACPTVPSAPTSLNSADIGNTSFTLSWTAPYNGGSAITGYKIYDDGSYYTSTTGATSKSVTGLTAGSTSTWTVKATNAVGDSAASTGKSVTQTNVSLESVTMTSTGQSNKDDACLESPSTTRYFDGAVAIQGGDTVYTDSAGTTKFNGGGNYYHDNDSGAGYRVSTVGYVDLLATCGCFVKGTLITLENGTQVNIETLKVGDRLLSTELNGLGLTNSVDSLIENSQQGSPILKFIPADVEHTIIINGGVLEATALHNHLIQRNGTWMYQQFQEIEVGDKMYDIDKNIIEVETIDYNIEDRTIYKITLEDTHTYYANGILTHNLK